VKATSIAKARERATGEQPFLPFSAPWVGEQELAELADAAGSGWLTAGPRTRRFEEAFAAYVGVQEAVATSSCTAALELALKAMDIGPGDAVITTPFTFAATANVIVHTGAEVVFVDISPRSYNLDPAAVARFLAENCAPSPAGHRVTRGRGRRVRALIAVHYAGLSAPMEELEQIGRRFHIAILEDAAHAAGARYRGRPVGTLGRAGCFSFYPTKNMTTAEGGMLTTDDRELAGRVRRLSQHGITRDGWQRYSAEGGWRYDVVEAGYKFNMTDLQAALGLVQLGRLDGFVDRRRLIAAHYDRAFQSHRELVVPPDSPDCHNSRHIYPLGVRSQRVSRDQFIERLKERQIGSSVHFIPLHLTRFYSERFGFRPGDFPNAERVFESVVSLPLYPAMTDADVSRVVDATLQILG